MTREDDEEMLHMLSLYRRLRSYADVAKQLGTTASTVRNRIVRVQTQDMLHDPKAADYWRRLGYLEK
jgi:DNA-binding Lrp family transcriptional regulator